MAAPVQSPAKASEASSIRNNFILNPSCARARLRATLRNGDEYHRE
jgi:hypothetical protein